MIEGSTAALFSSFFKTIVEIYFLITDVPFVPHIFHRSPKHPTTLSIMTLGSLMKKR